MKRKAQEHITDDKEKKKFKRSRRNPEILSFLAPFLLTDLTCIILRYDATLEFDTMVRSIGSPGSEDGQIRSGLHMAIHGEGEVLVADGLKWTLQSFDLATGRFLRRHYRYQNSSADVMIPWSVHSFSDDMIAIQLNDQLRFMDNNNDSVMTLPLPYPNMNGVQMARLVNCMAVVPNQNSIVLLADGRLHRYRVDMKAKKMEKVKQLANRIKDTLQQKIFLCYDAQEEAILLVMSWQEEETHKLSYFYFDPITLEVRQTHALPELFVSHPALSFHAHGSDILALVPKLHLSTNIAAVDKTTGLLTKYAELPREATRLLPVYNKRERQWQVLTINNGPNVVVIE